MATVSMHNAIPAKYHHAHVNPLTRFLDWSAGQENNRLLWLGTSLGLHGTVITPLVVLAILFGTGQPMIVPFAIAMSSMVLVLVVNLAALPTKYTVPAFFLSILIDIAVIAAVFLS